MIKIENYAKAYTEILKIIEYLPDSEYQKIPQKLIDQFQEKSDKEYVFEIQSKDDFENKKLEKSDATLMDVIQHYNTNELPILNENDVRIQCKGIQIEQPISRKSFERRMARPSKRNIDDIETILMRLKKSTRLISKDWRDNTND